MTIAQLEDSRKGRPLRLASFCKDGVSLVFFRSFRVSAYGNVLVAVVDERENSYAVEQDEIDIMPEEV